MYTYNMLVSCLEGKTAKRKQETISIIRNKNYDKSSRN
jgi:hypothetical protein